MEFLWICRLGKNGVAVTERWPSDYERKWCCKSAKWKWPLVSIAFAFCYCLDDGTMRLCERYFVLEDG